MKRRSFLKRVGALAGGVALATTGLGEGLAAVLRPAGEWLLGAGQRRFAIIHALERIGVMTPEQLERALFSSGISERFDLGAELAKMVESGTLGQSVSAEGLVYKLRDGVQAESTLSGEELTALNTRLDELKKELLAERDYIAQYTESSTGVVPVFLSIRRGASILMKINIIVPDVATAKTVTRNWRKNAHRAHAAVWESIGEGQPFPSFKPLEEGRPL